MPAFEEKATENPKARRRRQRFQHKIRRVRKQKRHPKESRPVKSIPRKKDPPAEPNKPVKEKLLMSLKILKGMINLKNPYRPITMNSSYIRFENKAPI